MCTPPVVKAWVPPSIPESAAPDTDKCFYCALGQGILKAYGWGTICRYCGKAIDP